jgi:hypothetical protein
VQGAPASRNWLCQNPSKPWQRGTLQLPSRPVRAAAARYVASEKKTGEIAHRPRLIQNGPCWV